MMPAAITLLVSKFSKIYVITYNEAANASKNIDNACMNFRNFVIPESLSSLPVNSRIIFGNSDNNLATTIIAWNANAKYNTLRIKCTRKFSITVNASSNSSTFMCLRTNVRVSKKADNPIKNANVDDNILEILYVAIKMAVEFINLAMAGIRSNMATIVLYTENHTLAIVSIVTHLNAFAIIA